MALACMGDMVLEGQKDAMHSSSAGDLFAAMDETFDTYAKYVNAKELTKEDLLNHERDALGFYFSGHPVAAIEGVIKNLRSHKVSELNESVGKARIVGLLNSFRQIKDKRNKQIAFIGFDDGTGSMEGIVSTEVLERYHLLLKTNSILIFSGSVELDDYRSKELNRRMFRMKVINVSSIESRMSQTNSCISLDVRNATEEHIKNTLLELKNQKKEFWKNGNCKLQLKVMHHGAEAIIELGESFQLLPSNENIKLLRELFGEAAVTID